MAIGTNLPPQAYTRETLTQAFAWLQTQPESIRKVATTPESLVSLYNRNQRFGPENRSISTAPISPLAGDTDLDDLSPTEAPISAQNFKTDLKTLAEGLKQFDSPRTQTHQVSHPVSQHANHSGVHQGTQHVPQAQQHQLRAPPVSTQFDSERLNPAVQAMIEEVKTTLNLSNESEAINMMVSIAYKNLKSLLA